MSLVGEVRIGQKAPDWRCEAVHKGVIEGVLIIPGALLPSVELT
jgi:hypothetical protein